MVKFKNMQTFEQHKIESSNSGTMYSDISNVDELIIFLQSVKQEYGNISIMRENEGDFFIGTTVEVSKKIDYYTGKVDSNENVVYIH